MRRKTIAATSVSMALAKGLKLMLKPEVVVEESRNGTVLVWDGPVLTHSENPLRRVLFSPLRDANPFFHLFESLWMLAGRNDLPWLAQFNKQMAAYSDDGGETQPAAYGHRWRSFFNFDQIKTVVEELKRNPGTRRAVLGMWSPTSDLNAAVMGSKDVPCNTECYFTIRDNRLYMSVQCRSNDLLWGAHGANAVHFSVLLEYVAAKVGVGVGEMFQYSWNYHLYDGILKHDIKDVVRSLEQNDRYGGVIRPSVCVTPIVWPGDDVACFDQELPMFIDWLDPRHQRSGGFEKWDGFRHEFLKGTAQPMYEAWLAHKRGDYQTALDTCSEIEGADWQMACTEWIERRAKAASKKDK